MASRIGAKRFARITRAVPGTSLLPVPFAIAAAVLVLLAATLTLDTVASSGRIKLYPWLSIGNLDDARAILGAILSAVSTVLALIFSVTLLVFSIAVSQFGPRLMPYFLRDRAMQVALGLFLGAFLHTLICFVVTGQRGKAVFVPQLSLLTNVALAFASFSYLVVYNHRIAIAIQTNNVLARIVEELNKAIGEHSRTRVVETGRDARARSGSEDSADAIRERCVAAGGVVKAVTSGYVQRVDHARLVRRADHREAVVCLAFRPGQFVLEGEALGHVVPAAHSPGLGSVIHGAVTIGQHRTLEQDLEFAFAQLSEIAIRALSPAINDTYTGLSCIDWLGDALRLLASLPAADGVWRTGGGTIRLLMPPLRFARVVRAAFDLVREAGADNPAVCIRLLQTFARLAPELRDSEQRRAILDQVDAVRQATDRMSETGIEREALEEAYRLSRTHLVQADDPAVTP